MSLLSWDYFDSRTRGWISFSNHISAAIERSFQAGHLNINEEVYGESVIVDFRHLKAIFQNNEVCLRRMSRLNDYCLCRFEWKFDNSNAWHRYCISATDYFSICESLNRRVFAYHFLVSDNDFFSYDIDLNLMIQTNLSTRTCRQIRKVSLPGDVSAATFSPVVEARSPVPSGSMNVIDDHVVAAVISACVKIKDYDDRCPICLDDFNDTDKSPLVLPYCSDHYFHGPCIQAMLKSKGRCALCGYYYVGKMGNQPSNGVMKTSYHPVGRIPLSGHEDIGTILLEYSFPSGIQSQDHPNPGRSYSGTHRHAYLPDNYEGRDIERLLRICFDRRLTFTIGESLTTGRADTVIWNGVHHKTSPSGGPTQYGYPDPSYMNRVREELRSKGIVEGPA